MAAERTVMRQVWLALGPVARLFRINTGRAWLSALGPAGVVQLGGGDVIVKQARPIAVGLTAPNGDPVAGTPDLIGWTPVVITTEMVGRTVPVMTVIETKASSGGRKRATQVTFVNVVQQSGGIAGFAASTGQALEIFETWKRGGIPDP
jgi:hypothetical protein